MKKDKIRILMVPSDNAGVGHFRNIWPAKTIEKYHKDEFDVEINQYPNLDDIEYLKKFDIIHFHRSLGPNDQEDKNFKTIKDLGIILVMDIDDYWEPFTEHPLYLLIMNDKYPEKITNTIKKVDYVTTTTNIFADEIRKLNPNVLVIPNAVDPEDKMWKTNDTRLPGDDRCRIAWIGGSCYDKYTEILTENGFKLFKDLEEGEKVACLNPDSNQLEYHEPINYLKEHFNGELNVGKNNLLDYAVTPNHKMFVSQASDLSKKELDFKLIASKDVHGKNLHFKKTSNWTGNEAATFTIPALYNEKTIEVDNGDTLIKKKVLKKYTLDKEVNMDSWLKFFGFWTAQGWTSKTSGLYQVGIAQIKDNNYLEIMFNLLEDMGYNPTYTKDKTQIRVFDRQLWNYLSQFENAEDKFIPKEIRNLSPRQLDILLEWYLKGDGSQEKDGERFDKRYNNIKKFKTSRKRGYTVSKKLADNIQEICLKLDLVSTVTNRGKRNSIMKDGRSVIAKHDAYVISIGADSVRSRKNPLLRSEHQYTEKYNDFVYCVEVPHNIIFTRRNGKTMWCGNSHLHDLKLMEQSFQLLYNNSDVEDKFQISICGFDTRGTVTQIDELGRQKQRPIQPQETCWARFEEIFTNNYKSLYKDPEYVEWLKKIDKGEYKENVLTKQYMRRWTLPLTQYAKHYDYFDVCLAPLNEIDMVKNASGVIMKKENVFNKVKSELKIIETGMKKKTLIAQDFGIYKELIKNGENGLLVNKNDKGWYQQMRKVILDKDLRESMAQNLHDFVVKTYNIKTVTETRVGIYKQILNEKGK